MKTSSLVIEPVSDVLDLLGEYDPPVLVLGTIGMLTDPEYIVKQTLPDPGVSQPPTLRC